MPKAHSPGPALCLLSGVPPCHPRVQCSRLIYTCHSPPLAEPTRVSGEECLLPHEQHSLKRCHIHLSKKHSTDPLSLSQLGIGSLSECSLSFLPFPLITLVILLFPPKLSRCFISFASRKLLGAKVFFLLIHLCFLEVLRKDVSCSRYLAS